MDILFKSFLFFFTGFLLNLLVKAVTLYAQPVIYAFLPYTFVIKPAVKRTKDWFNFKYIYYTL